MMEATLFREKINMAYEESEKFSVEAKCHTIEIGSDAHLDIINVFKPMLSKIKQSATELNDLIELNFPSDNKEFAQLLKGELHKLHSSLLMFLDNIKDIQFRVDSLEFDRTSIRYEADQIEEYINDINCFLLVDNSEYFNIDSE